MKDNEIIKALECCDFTDIKDCEECPLYHTFDCSFVIIDKSLDLINRQKAEVERLKEELQKQKMILEDIDNAIYPLPFETDFDKTIKHAKSEAIKELCGKITEVFMRYAHLHPYAEGARKDFIEAVDGTEIEMQSVWDVFTLKKYEMSEYEEMGRLQKNIETIATERLLTELEKDFCLLVKEMTEE